MEQYNQLYMSHIIPNCSQRRGFTEDEGDSGPEVIYFVLSLVEYEKCFITSGPVLPFINFARYFFILLLLSADFFQIRGFKLMAKLS